MISILIFLFTTIVCSTVRSQHWTYEEQENWAQTFGSCGGRRQSPINIKSREVIINTSLKLNFNKYEIPIKNAIANNNGHTVRISLNPNDERPVLTGSAVNGQYIFEELHFHWGQNDLEGSEHSIDNDRASVELHFVHYNEKYGSLTKAREYKDGIVVLTVFLELSNNDNIALNPIIDILPQIRKFNASSRVRSRIVLEKLMPITKQFFMKYSGSLTTPPCSESATFLLVINPLKISSFQLSKFRQLSEEPENGRSARVIQNIREKQRRNGRIVEVSYPFNRFTSDTNSDDEKLNDVIIYENDN